MVKFEFLAFYDREKEPRSRCRQIWHQFLAYFVCQIGSSPLRPRRSFPQGISRRESRYLAQKRDKYFDAISRQIFLPFGFLYGSKNWLAKIFGFSEQPYNSVRTSLVPLSICLWEIFSGGGRRVTGASKVPPPTKFLENFCLRGVENTAVSTLRCQHCGVNTAVSTLRRQRCGVTTVPAAQEGNNAVDSLKHHYRVLRRLPDCFNNKHCL